MLFYYEFGNLLLRKSRFDTRDLDRALRALLSLPIVPVSPTSSLLRRAAQLGREHDLSFYDASFVALAAELDCPLVTADERLVHKLRELAFVIPLSRMGALEP
jgi:predicted nucleic acid-binding protein